MAKSTRQQGAYYLRKSVDYWKALGWKVEKLEVPQYFFMKGKMIMGSRRDLLGADLGVWKGDEFYLVQVKSTTEERKDGLSKVRSEAKINFEKVGVPLKKIIMVWTKGYGQPIVEYL